MVHLEKEEEIYQYAHEAALENAKVACNEAKEKVENWLNLWINEMLTNKSVVYNIMRLKAKDMDSHVTQVYENGKPVSCFSKGDTL